MVCKASAEGAFLLLGYRNPIFFFFHDTATTEIYTLSLHDALPISPRSQLAAAVRPEWCGRRQPPPRSVRRDRKSTRLNSSHSQTSYDVFCLKKKKREHYLFAFDRSQLRKRIYFSRQQLNSSNNPFYS